MVRVVVVGFLVVGSKRCVLINEHIVTASTGLLIGSALDLDLQAPALRVVIRFTLASCH